MSELLRQLRARVDAIVEPHVQLYGDTAPVVKMALRVLAEAEDIEREMSALKVSTERAAEITRWHPETLQSKARAKLNGEALPGRWAALEIEETPAGYLTCSAASRRTRAHVRSTGAGAVLRDDGIRVVSETALLGQACCGGARNLRQVSHGDIRPGPQLTRHISL